ncbi:hypothetical protein C8R44DRAFT_725086 [Mycena epipterygia]|nr:hypothetical protein C8R44DRAFT_725086 [Mycena epipterygia]
MHRCLQIKELVTQILSHLPTGQESAHWGYYHPAHRSIQPQLRDLAVIARTCTTFHGHTLDVLWSSSTLINLLRCMPPDLWSMADAKRMTTKRLHRPVRVTDWERVRVYASRVKRLFSDSRDCGLSEVFPTISLCLPGDLLQTLQSLYWRHSEEDFHYIHLFLRPSITTIFFEPSSALALSLISALAPKCPKLKKNVTITSSYSADDARAPKTRAVSLFVRELKCVESISVNVLDTEALEQIRRFPSLTSLQLRALPAAFTFFSTADTQSFVSLRSLILDCLDIVPTTRFLGGLSQIPLVSFSVSFPDYYTAALAHTFYTTLPTAFSPSYLTNLCLDTDPQDINMADAANYLIHRDSVRLLTCFVNLTHLYISSPVGMDLNDATISDLARAWPRIESLSLSSHRYISLRPGVTLECLLSLATNCPRLARLTMTFDGTVVPAPNRNRVSQHQLDSIDVDRAISLGHLSEPATEREEEEYDDLDEAQMIEQAEAIGFHNLWKEVEALLPDLLAIREEERIWAKNAWGS